MAKVVDEDVQLAGCQYGGEMTFKITTYSLEVSMNDIAEVEVAEALGNIGKLATKVNVG